MLHAWPGWLWGFLGGLGLLGALPWIPVRLELTLEWREGDPSRARLSLWGVPLRRPRLRGGRRGAPRAEAGDGEAERLIRSLLARAWRWWRAAGRPGAEPSRDRGTRAAALVAWSVRGFLGALHGPTRRLECSLGGVDPAWLGWGSGLVETVRPFLGEGADRYRFVPLFAASRRELRVRWVVAASLVGVLRGVVGLAVRFPRRPRAVATGEVA